MKLSKIIEKLYNNQLETTKQVDAIQAHANNLKGLNLARLKLIDKLDKIEAEPSGNPVQLNLGEAEVLKPTSEDKYIIMKSDKTYCQYANGKKAFEVTEAINNTEGLEIIKLGEIEAILLVKSSFYGSLCYGYETEIIKLCPESQPSANIEQLKEVVQELESDHSCTHPHWEETPTKNIIIKTCSTCGAQKYE